MRYGRLTRFCLVLLGATLLSACTDLESSYNGAVNSAKTSISQGFGSSNSRQPQEPQTSERESTVVTVDAHRITPTKPDDRAQLLYSDENGVRARVGTNADRQLSLSMAQGDIQWSILDANNQPLMLQRSRSAADNTFSLVGRAGTRFELEFMNSSDRAYEVVATVDGLDVMSGQPGSIAFTGYILYPHKKIRIEGFRQSDTEVSTFRFSSTTRAVTASSPGAIQPNIGVIGAVLFRLQITDKNYVPPKPNTPKPYTKPYPFPADKPASPPPDIRNR